MGGLPRDGFSWPGWVHGLCKAFTHGSFTPAAMAAGADLGEVDSRGRMSLACGCAGALRLGALELAQLLKEGAVGQRSRVNRWLTRYAVSTRLPCRCRESSDHRS